MKVWRWEGVLEGRVNQSEGEEERRRGREVGLDEGSGKR